MLKMTASDPNYPAWDWLLTMRAAWVNAHVYYDLRTIPEVERKAMVAELDGETVTAFEELAS
jgi:hypothetical protein